MQRILLIDDDEHLGGPLASYLRRFDFDLHASLTPSEGLARLAEGGFDAAILDVMLPEMDGFELCRRIRRDADPRIAQLPLLMLTARGELTDRVVGLELGADDYLPKPFEPRELAARLGTILRRLRATGAPTGPGELSGPGARTASSAPSAPSAAPAASPAPPAPPVPSADRLDFDGLHIDLDRRSVLREGETVELTSTEFELLVLLARAPGKVFSRDDILNRLRGRDADLYTRAVDLLVSRLRKKLEPLQCIKTLRNAGYTFAAARDHRTGS